MLERPFAHCYETGRMRRVHLRGRENILKRLLIHIAGYNLSPVLRLMIGKATPRGLQDLAVANFLTLIALINQLWQVSDAVDDSMPPGMIRSQHSTFAVGKFDIETSTPGCQGTELCFEILISLRNSGNHRPVVTWRTLGLNSRHRTCTVRRGSLDQRIDHVIKHIQCTYEGPLSLTELARLVNLSPSRLRHLFKRETGLTVHEYLKTTRMKRARELLESTFLSVKQIVANVGLADSSHFVRDFKRTHGVTPRQYRSTHSRFGQ